MEEGKKLWLSKTLWTNVLVAAAAMFAPGVSNWISANPETMVMIWAGVNALLRLVTKEKLSLY